MRNWTFCSHLGSTTAGSFVLLLSPSSAVAAACSSSALGVSQWTHCLLRCLALSVLSSTFPIRLRRSVGGVLHLIFSATVTSMVGGSCVSPDCSSRTSVSLLNSCVSPDCSSRTSVSLLKQHKFQAKQHGTDTPAPVTCNSYGNTIFCFAWWKIWMISVAQDAEVTFSQLLFSNLTVN